MSTTGLSIWTAGDLALVGEQDFAGVEVDRRHRPLAEDKNVFVGESEIGVFLKERDRFGVRRGARLDAERNPRSVFRRHSADAFDMNLEERRFGNGADRVNSFGVVEVEARPLTARDDDDRDFSGAEVFLALGDRFERRNFVAGFDDGRGGRFRERRVGGAVEVAQIAQLERGRLFGAVGQRGGGRRVEAVFEEAVELGEVDLFDLFAQRVLLVGGQLVPKG